MTFNQWLKTQVKRDDIIGDVARNAAMDTKRKPYRGDLKAWIKFLSDGWACREAKLALIEAWKEYKTSQ